MAKWRIYYEDGSTFSDENGTLKEAPAFGVMAVICDPDLWRAGDFAGLIDWLATTGLVKFGRLTDNDTYNRVLHEARHDQDISPNRYVLEQCDYYWYKGD